MEYIKLSNGINMPILGFGVYQVTKEECERVVLDAINVGYRKIDTAQSYFNEEEVGSALKKSELPREEFFITTKVWVEHYGYEATKASIKESLKKLQTTYIDLVLLHQPFGDVYGAWRALEDLYEEGVIKAIGISNFYPDRMVDICSFNKIRPMVNQIEISPLNAQYDAQTWNEKYGVKLESWAPFGEGRNNMFNNETLVSIGKKYNKTSAQVILRWLIQRGIAVNPKTIHKERMIQNFDVFDFELSNEDMETIKDLDTKTSLFFSHQNPNMVEWFAHMVEERKTKHDSSKEKKNW